MYVSCASQKEQLNEYIEQGNSYYKLKDYNAALNSFNQALHFDNTIEIKIKLISIYLHLEEFSQARTMLDTIIKQDSKNEIIQELNAYYYLLIKDNQKSIELYTLLLEDTIYQPRALSNLGVLYARIGDLETSYDYFQKSIQTASIDINVLDSYIHVLIALYKKYGNTPRGTLISLDIQFVIERMALEYKQENISFEEMRQVAHMFLEVELSQYSYSLYAFLVKKVILDFAKESGTETNSTSGQDDKDESLREETGIAEENITKDKEVYNEEIKTNGTSGQDDKDESLREETGIAEENITKDKEVYNEEIKTNGTSGQDDKDESLREETGIAEENITKDKEAHSEEINNDLTSNVDVSQESNTDSRYEHSKLKEVLFILSQILFNKDYDIIVPQRFLRGLQYLEASLKAGYGVTQEEKNTLIDILKKVPTDVLSVRIRQIYSRYNIDYNLLAISDNGIDAKKQ